jgi:hypothetical protein
MELDPLVIAELRALFKSGATPSRLMRLIVAHLGELPLHETDRLIRAYFREAFGIPMFRASAGLLASGHEGLRISHVNGNVIHLMIANRKDWDKDVSENDQLATSWMDDLYASNETSLIEQCPPALLMELKGVWDSLDDRTKKYIKRLTGNCQVLYEKVAILSTLVEQLQQQVLALENGAPVTTEASSGLS